MAEKKKPAVGKRPQQGKIGQAGTGERLIDCSLIERTSCCRSGGGIATDH